MSTNNPFDCSIKRRTLLKAGLTLGALKFTSPASFLKVKSCRSQGIRAWGER